MRKLLHTVKGDTGIPEGYTLLEYISNVGSTRILTGLYNTSDSFKIEIRVRAVTGSFYIFQSRNSSKQITGISGSQSGNTIGMGLGGSTTTSGTPTSSITRTTGNILSMVAIAGDGSGSLYVNDETDGIEDTAEFTYTDFTPDGIEFGIWGNTQSNYVTSNARVYYARMWQNGQLVLDGVPVKNSNDEYGLYDRARGIFLGADTGTIIGA